MSSASTNKKQVVQMVPELVTKLAELRKRRNFNVKDWIDKKTDMTNDYFRKYGLKAAVVNASGGIDSSCTLAILKAASLKPDSPIKRVVGIAQPIHSTAKIQNRAYETCTALGVECMTVDQSDLFVQLKGLCDKAANVDGNGFVSGQLKSYMRTPVGFYIAQLLTQAGTPCVVVGTGNKDEDGYLFYFCKAGDGVADIQLINDLHKSEVFAVSKELGVPNSVIVAPPSADLWQDQTDEEELGFTYDFVELLLEFMTLTAAEQDAFTKSLSADALQQFEHLSKEAKAVHYRNKHKERYPYNINLL